MTVRFASRELSRTEHYAAQLALATAGAVALALLSQVKIWMPGSPVPFTLQTFAVILLGGFFGARLAAAATAEYLLLGVCGLPVFAGWRAGLTGLTGPTGGYLLGFVLAALLCGVIYARAAARPYGARVLGAWLAGSAGVAVIYLCGWLWLAGWMHISLAKAFAAGVMPFVMPDILKVSLAASLLAVWRKGAA